VDPRRAVPSVERVLASLDGLPHRLLADAARAAVDDARSAAAGGRPVDVGAVLADARARVEATRLSMLGPVVNATGVIAHTNLGRSPVARDALADAAAVAAGYSNLEYRLDTGRRGSRHDHAGALLALACGAEAGLVVNNNAAAVLLTLSALARGREVVVSRGELVEIGGGFRIPDVMAESGARLVEVGTTNRTRRTDYDNALTADTALVLRVHPSNYRMVGFVESVALPDLARLGPPLVVDAGSGLLDAETPWLGHRPGWLGDEPGIRQCLEAGAALVTFSADKLLGGPQAGVVVGRADLVARVGRHPLARAVRAGKLTLAALQSVAGAYLDGRAAELPLWRMATLSLDALRARAEALVEGVPGAKVVDTDAVVGGGALPGRTIPSAAVALPVGDSRVGDALAALRSRRIVARTDDGAVVCDLRTVDPADDGRVAEALCQVLAEAAGE